MTKVTLISSEDILKEIINPEVAKNKCECNCLHNISVAGICVINQEKEDLTLRFSKYLKSFFEENYTKDKLTDFYNLIKEISSNEVNKVKYLVESILIDYLNKSNFQNTPILEYLITLFTKFNKVNGSLELDILTNDELFQHLTYELLKLYYFFLKFFIVYNTIKKPIRLLKKRNYKFITIESKLNKIKTENNYLKVSLCIY